MGWKSIRIWIIHVRDEKGERKALNLNIQCPSASENRPRDIFNRFSMSSYVLFSKALKFHFVSVNKFVPINLRSSGIRVSFEFTKLTEQVFSFVEETVKVEK
jgi:hypothetical protein